MASFAKRMYEVRSAHAKGKMASLAAVTDALMTEVNANMHRFVSDTVTFAHITPERPLCSTAEIERALFAALEMSGHGITLEAKIYPPSATDMHTRDFVDVDVEVQELWRVEVKFTIHDQFTKTR